MTVKRQTHPIFTDQLELETSKIKSEKNTPHTQTSPVEGTQIAIVMAGNFLLLILFAPPWLMSLEEVIMKTCFIGTFGPS